MALFSEIPGLDLRLCKSGIFTPLLRCRLSGVVGFEKTLNSFICQSQAKFLERAQWENLRNFCLSNAPLWLRNVFTGRQWYGINVSHVSVSSKHQKGYIPQEQRSRYRGLHAVSNTRQSQSQAIIEDFSLKHYY